jgi:N-acetylneuraminic acid mutarotase
MRKVIPILTVLITFCFPLTAQIGSNSQWTWLKGADTANQKCIFGTRGVAAPDNTPGARVVNVNWKDNSGNLWLFGGLREGDASNDMWKYNPGTNEWTWVSGDSTLGARGVYGIQGVTNSSNMPGARYYSVSWVDASGKFWLFGGQGYDANDISGILDDLWRYDPDSNLWTWMKGHSVLGNITGVYGPQGAFGVNYLPGNRVLSSTWTDKNGNLWLFGGQGWGQSCGGVLNDLWKYNPITNQWAWMKGDKTCNSQGDYGTQGISAITNNPSARTCSVTWTDLAGNLYLFGGFLQDNNGGGPNNELWKFDISTNQWTWVLTNGVKPKARMGMTSCMDKDGNLWLFGGEFYPGWNEYYGDLWKYDPIISTWIWVKGSPGFSTYAGSYGTKGVPSPSNVIGVRSWQSMWADNSGNLWVFGGENWGGMFGNLNDLWKLSSNLDVAHNNATCSNSNGSITVYAFYGTAPYIYSIDGINFQSSNTFTGLAAGVYTITIKDAADNIKTTTATLLDESAPSVIANAMASCGNNNGSITVTTSGGKFPFQYSIDGTTFQASNVFTGLTANSYTVYVKDANGCISTTTTTINNVTPPTLTANTTTATCSNNNGSITANASGGTPPLKYSINGTSYQSGNIFTGLLPNSYTVYVKDVNGCITTTIVTVFDEGAPSLTVNTTGATCGNNNGVITAVATGGKAPLLFSINGITYQTSNVFTGLAANNYGVYVKDANSCRTSLATTIPGERAASITAIATAASCGNNDGTITATASSGTSPFQYSIDGINYQSSNIFNNLASRTYTVYLNDANGCIASYPIIVSSLGAPPSSTISIYPNPSRNNQFTIALGNQLLGEYRIRILNMFGQMVYKTVINNSCACCPGSYSIKLPYLLSTGVYNVEIIAPNGTKNVQRLMVSVK